MGTYRGFIQVMNYLPHAQYRFKIPYFSLWTDCICGIYPGRQSAICSAEEILKKHYSMILVLSMQCECRDLKYRVQNWGSVLVLRKELSYFSVLCLSRMINQIITSFQMFSSITRMVCLHMLFSFSFSTVRKKKDYANILLD